jgi:putative tricarboxylic transport membrane protein
MEKINIFSSLFLILIGIFFAVSSLKMGLGSISAPGPGLLPFGTGILLILFSLGTILESHLESMAEVKKKVILFRGKRWGVSLSILASLFIYALVLEIFGFILVNFLTFTFLFKIAGKQSWRMALGASALTTASAYFLFDYLLKVGLPRGFLGF